jgi:CRP/FNR family transcriptional regulator, cyclic AMP receptor protein
VTRDELVTVLRQCSLLSDLGQTALEQLSEHVSLMHGQSGDRLYNEGEAADGLYIVAQGTCVAMAKDMAGAERIVRTIPTFDSFGELSLLLRGERLLSVQAQGDVVLLELSTAEFRKMKQNKPELCLMLVMAIVRRLGRVLDESRESMKRVMLRYHAGVDGT